MKRFVNLRKIITDNHLTKTKLAEILFPDNKFPARALARVVKGETELTASQVATLAEYIGATLDQLYEPDRWKWDVRDGMHIFMYGNTFRAELDMKTWITRLYSDDTLIKEDTLCAPNTSIVEYFSTVEKLIQDWDDLA